MSPFSRAVAALTFGVSALTTSLALADEAGPPPPPEPQKATPLHVRVSKPLALAEAPRTSHIGTALAAIAVLIGGGVWIARRRSASGQPGKEHQIHIAARRAIGVRSELIVVEVDGHPMLLGVTPGAIQRLAVLPEGSGDAIDEEADLALDAEPGFQVPASGPREAERPRDRERDMPMTVPEPRRAAPPPVRSIMPDRRGPRVRESLPLEEQVRGLMRDRRAS
jgi:flagellar biogenesis protein FliO